MENFNEIVRMRNIRGCIIAERENGHRVEMPREFIENIVNILEKNEPKILSINDIEIFLLKQRLKNLLDIDDFEMYV